LIPRGEERHGRQGISQILDPAKVCGELLKTGSPARPAMPSIVKDDPWWLDAKDDPHARLRQAALLGPDAPQFWVYNRR